MNASMHRDPELRVCRIVVCTALAATLLLAGRAMAGDSTIPDRDSATQIRDAFETQDTLGVEFDPASGLDGYLAWAAGHSPALRAAFYEWMAAIEKTGHVGALPDPQLMYGYYIQSVETRVGPQNQRLSLRQAFPWFGTLGAKKDAASHAADAAYRRFQAEELKLFFQVTAAYDEYYYLGRERSISQENLELLQYWESVARARYRVSLTPHPDVIKSQVELGKLEDRLLRVESELGPAATRLRELLDLPDSVSLPLPEQLAADEGKLPRQQVLAAIEAGNPNLLTTLSLIEKERAAARLAAKRSWPSLSVGVDYIQTGPAINPNLPESGKDAWIATAGVSIPIWFGANGARRREAEARTQHARYAYEDLQNRLTDTAERSLFEFEDAVRKVKLYRDGLVPKAEQSLNATYTSYEAGETDFLNVLDAQRQLLDFQLKYERSLASLATRRAEIEMLTGRPLRELNEPERNK